MTKKHFKQLANSTAFSHPERTSADTEATYTAKMIVWGRCVTAVANVCHANNPAFDRAKFLDACEQS